MSEKNRRYRLLSSGFVALLVSLCATLGVIQYRSIGEVSRAEHDRLERNLNSNLEQISEDFASEIASAFSVLSGGSPGSSEAEKELEYVSRYERWKATSRHAGLVRRFALVIRDEDSLQLRSFDVEKARFTPAEWPQEWANLRERMDARIHGGPPPNRPGKRSTSELGVLESPLFERPMRGGRGEDRDQPRAESGWRIVELNLDYVRATLLPELLQRYLGDGEKLAYHAVVVARDSASTVIYDSDPDHSREALHADASIPLFDMPFGPMFGRGGPDRGRGKASRAAQMGGDHGRWLLSVQHRTGSLEALVAQSRRRSLAVTGEILALMLVTAGALAQFSRRAQKLADLQMEFVAGVSHELRTPLAVIRTAAHNLEARVINNSVQVQRYGALIEKQSKELADIVERILLFSNARAGRVIITREVVEVGYLIEHALVASAAAVEESRCAVERRIEPGLPPILGDPTALRHAVLNLIDNAAKYGSDGGWIGISADRSGDMVEIRVADRGPGIPVDEQSQIFEAFRRGRTAVEDQIRGTGLGLSLVQRIVRAHGGTVELKSEPGAGSEFILRIPVAPVEALDEFTDSVSRG